MMARNQTSRHLAEDLAEFLEQSGWMVWVEMPTGSVILGNVGRVDVIAIAKSYRLSIKGYEVKASRTDFLRDVNAGKFIKYKERCHQLYFASEAGVLTREDIPTGCGLITRGDKGWHVQRAPHWSEVELTPEFMMALLMKNYDTHRPNLRNLRVKAIEEYKGLHTAAQMFGNKFAFDISQSADYINQARELTKEINKALGENHQDIFNALWSLRLKVTYLLSDYKYAEEISRIAEILAAISSDRAKMVPEELERIASKIKAKEKTAP